MSFSDVGRTSLRNNKRQKQKMFGAYKEIPNKRKFKKKEKNPKIKEMSKKELKAYRKALETKAQKKRINFWLAFTVLFLGIFIYLFFRA